MVSTQPDVTQKMGVKEVLYTTRYLGWGVDTRRYRSFGEFHDEFPRVLGAGGARVMPIPDQAPAAIARLARERLRRADP
jgi:hypothetical protein